MQRSSLIVTVVAVVAIVAIVLLVNSRNAPADGLGPSDGGSANWVHADIMANGAQDLAGIQVTVVYNPAVLRYVSTSEGSLLDDGEVDAAMLLDTIDASQMGAVKNVIVLRLKPEGVSGSGTVASLQFERVADGASGLALQDVLVSDSNGQPLSTGTLSLNEW